MKNYWEKVPSLGAIVAAAGCPICFPALAAVGSVFGLGALAAYENQFILITQIFVGLSLVFAVISFKRTRFKLSLTIALLSGILIFAAWYVFWNEALVYLGLAGIFISAVWNIILEKRIGECKTANVKLGGFR
ncbi:MerC family mercury resistance protein [Candidatus Spongiihabitans sp.]|uniref:MerC family mercury resistance protein n=1 Tax=Candidatus Spongiihabitans sp. TaxID=3101308 RepID=UPI003C7A9502